MNHERTANSPTALLACPEISSGTAASTSAGAVPNEIRAKKNPENLTNVICTWSPGAQDEVEVVITLLICPGTQI